MFGFLNNDEGWVHGQRENSNVKWLHTSWIMSLIPSPLWRPCSTAPPAMCPGPPSAQGRLRHHRTTGSSEPGRELHPPERMGERCDWRELILWQGSIFKKHFHFLSLSNPLAKLRLWSVVEELMVLQMCSLVEKQCMYKDKYGGTPNTYCKETSCELRHNNPFVHEREFYNAILSHVQFCSDPQRGILRN